MFIRFLSKPLLSAMLALVAIPLAGCSGGGAAIKSEHVENLDAILRAYFDAVENLKQPPKNEGELKPFLEKLGDPTALRVSPRDQQPYTILWGIDPRLIESSDPANPRPTLVAYESRGRGGNRYVATSFGVSIMAENDFQRDYASALSKESPQ